MPSRRLTPGGNAPPSCKYLWTASRPVNTTPEINTSSPTLSARILSSVKGKLSFVMADISLQTGLEVHAKSRPCTVVIVIALLKRHLEAHDARADFAADL